MTISSTDIAIFAELSLASGRVAYSLTKDEIFRPLREWVYARSAPDSDGFLMRGEEGDRTVPARLFHDSIDGERKGIRYDPMDRPRDPGFFGQLIECPYCLSFWTSLLAVLNWWALGDSVAIIAAPLAVWALANLYAVKGL